MGGEQGEQSRVGRIEKGWKNRVGLGEQLELGEQSRVERTVRVGRTE